MLEVCACAGLLPEGTTIVSSCATACASDVYTRDGPKPHPVPTALDKAGIARVSAASEPVCSA